jgi:hypothetical protein
VGPGWDYDTALNPSASAGTYGSRILLSWKKVSGANGYNVYKSDMENGLYQKITDSPLFDLTFSDETVTPDFLYFYKITAVTASGEGDFSEPVCGYVVPADLTCSYDETQKRLTLEWQVVSGASCYLILVSSREGGIYANSGTALRNLSGATVNSAGYLVLTTTGSTASISFDRNRESGTNLYIKISAVYETGNSSLAYLYSRYSPVVFDPRDSE